MPYTYGQCRVFGYKEGRGEQVPSDWQDKCKGVTKPKGYKPKRGGKKAHRNRMNDMAHKKYS